MKISTILILCSLGTAPLHAQTEERLRQLAELLRLSYDAIVVWKLDGGIEIWSRGAAERPSCPGSSGFQAESARFRDARLRRRTHASAPGDNPARAL